MTHDQDTPAHADEERVLYAKEVHQINLVLGKFLQKSGANTVLLVAEAGHLVCRQGESSPAGEDTITALVTGTFQASQAMAGMLGAGEFSSLIPCSDTKRIMLLRADEHALLCVIFQDDMSVTLIRTYALEAIRRIGHVMRSSGDSGDPDERIQGYRFDSEIDGALSDVFG